MSTIDQDLLERFAAMDESELFEELGRSVRADDGVLHSKPLNSEEAEQAGRSYFRTKYPELRQAICDGSVARAVRDKNDKQDLFVAIADVISAPYTGIPLISICFIVSRMGLSAFCDPATGCEV